MIWIDVKDFKNYGGWKLDTQYAHFMGSAYLIACETPGETVTDATTTFQVEEAGVYRVWVRNRNWYGEHKPGQFQVAVDDKVLPSVLGTLTSSQWLWQIAGDVQLESGTRALDLKDLTGYFGRCSTIVITKDMDYVPPRPMEAFEAERAKVLGLSLEPEASDNYDVVVVGAGPGGIPAAIAAARKGMKTLLIDNRSILGGNSSDEKGVGFNGASARQVNARDGGICEELIRLKGNKNLSWTKALEQMCDVEENLTVIYNMHVVGAQTEEGLIQTVEGRHTLEGTRHLYTAKYFIDCTGDGWLGYLSGAKYRIGREAKWQHKEEFAPETADLLTMSGCLMKYTLEDTGKPVDFKAPAWVPQFNEGKAYGRHIERVSFNWWVEAPNDLDDIYDGEATRDELFRVIMGHYNYLKNLWDEKERAVNYRFNFMNFVNARRESRRIMGDYILTQNDCVNGTYFEDTVCHTGWPIDLHHPEGLYSGEKGPFFSNTHVPLVHLPYRCLYSRSIGNLFMAGRNISVTHIALGTTRIQGSIANMGQAVGTAAAMCIDKDIRPRELGTNYITALQQQLLKDDQYIPRVKSDDSEDLAQQSTVTASSVATNEIYPIHLGIEDKLLPLDCERATFFARDVSEEIPSLYLKIYNETDAPIPLTIQLKEQKDPDGYEEKDNLCLMTQEIPPGENWVEYPVNVRTELRYLWIMVEATAGLSWRIWRCPPLDWTRSERNNADEKFENIRRESHMLSLFKPEVIIADCSPANVINGYSRINSPEEYAWVSSEEATLPQWIELAFEDEKQISQIHLTFDTDMNNMAMLNPISELPKEVVTDYTVEVLSDGKWLEVANVSGNFNRKRVHNFEKVRGSKIRVTVLASGDNKTARVFEIRAYA